MKLKNKNVLLIALFYVILIGFFILFKHSANDNAITENQDTLNTNLASTTKKIALTFDDGPYGTSTEKILDILKQENVHATFFVIGKNVEKFPDIAKRIVTEGNLIENHSYNHSKKMTSMSTEAFNENIKKAESTIFLYTGQKPKFFRPPYGRISTQMYDQLNRNGYKTILWDTEARDWDYEKTSTDYIEKTITKNAIPNGIIVLHDGRDTEINYPRENMIDALAYIIKQLKNDGYNFVTVDKIVKTKPYFD